MKFLQFYCEAGCTQQIKPIIGKIKKLKLTGDLYFSLLRFKKCLRYTQNFLDAQAAIFEHMASILSLVYLPSEADEIQILEKLRALACITKWNFQPFTAPQSYTKTFNFFKNYAL